VSNLIQINKRYFESRYSYSKPQLSQSQNLIFFPDFQGDDKIIDVYDCRSDDFFQEKSILNRDVPYFVCTIQVSDFCAEDFNHVETFVTSDNVVGVFSKKVIHVFDISDVGASKQVKPKSTFELKNKIYDYIMDFNLNVDDTDRSWVTLASKEFSFTQLMRFGELI
jgi:hypothetical protein